MEYTFLVKGDRLRLINVNNGVVGNYNSYDCEFIFERGTQGLTWFAVFTCGDSIYERLIVNNKCAVPNDMLSKAGIIYIGIYGIETAETVTKRVVTNMCFISLRVGAYRDSYDMPDMCKEYADEIAAYKTQIDEEITKVREECDNKAVKAHRHLTSDVYSTGTVAYDLSYYMGGWELDGIAIGVIDIEKFKALDKVYITYKGNAIALSPSSFRSENRTAYESWGNSVDEKHKYLPVYLYVGKEFDTTSNTQEVIEPIFGNVNLNVLLGSKAEKNHIHDAADIHIADGRDLEQKLVDMGADTSELVAAVSELNDTVDEKIDKTAIGTYCKYNLVAGVTSQLFVAVAYPIPGVSKYTLIANGKQMGETTTIGQPLKIASILTTATNVYLCFMDSTGLPIYYAQMNDNIKNDKFTTGILTYFTPSNPWTPGGIDVPVAGEDFE